MTQCHICHKLIERDELCAAEVFCAGNRDIVPVHDHNTGRSMPKVAHLQNDFGRPQRAARLNTRAVSRLQHEEL